MVIDDRYLKFIKEKGFSPSRLLRKNKTIDKQTKIDEFLKDNCIW